VADKSKLSPETRRKRRKLGDLKGAGLALWHALETAERLLEDKDPLMQLKAVHATVQAVGVYTRWREVSDLEKRLKEFEQVTGDAT
jgi:hypothetical protein